MASETLSTIHSVPNNWYAIAIAYKHLKMYTNLRDTAHNPSGTDSV
jgi:hypothetical protein